MDVYASKVNEHMVKARTSERVECSNFILTGKGVSTLWSEYHKIETGKRVYLSWRGIFGSSLRLSA